MNFVCKTLLLVPGGPRSKSGHSRATVDEADESHPVHAYSVVQASDVY